MVELVIKSTFFGWVLVLFIKFYQQTSFENLFPEIPFVELFLADAFVERLQLRQCELYRQEFKSYRFVDDFSTQGNHCSFNHFWMIENQLWYLVYRNPFGSMFFGQFPVIIIDLDQGIISYRNSSGSGIAFNFAKTVQLLHVNIRKPGKLIEYSIGSFVEAFCLP